MKTLIVTVAIVGMILTGCSVEFNYGYDGAVDTEPVDDGAVVAPEPPSSGGGGDAERLARAAYDDTIAIMKGWDPGFDAPELIFFDEPVRACGDTFDTGNAYYCGSRNALYLDVGYLEEAESGTEEDGEAATVVAHEAGHSLEAQGVAASTAVGSEDYADCIAGAVAAAAGWDVDIVADYVHSIGSTESDRTHGTPRERRAAVRGGATEGHRYCDTYLLN